MLDPVKNFAKVTVSTGYDAAAVTIELSLGHGAFLPSPATDGAFNLVWWDSTNYDDPADDPNVEIVRCTARSTDTLTVTRNQEGSGASTKNTGSATYKMILGLTKKTVDDIDAKMTEETPSGTINGSNAVFTVSNTNFSMLFLNGMYQIGGGVDYTLVGTTITYVNAPPTGSVHRVLFKT